MTKKEFNLSEKLFRWKLKHSKRMVIDGSERYWYLAIQELDKDVKEFIRLLKEEFVIGKFTSKFIKDRIDKLAGDKLI